MAGENQVRGEFTVTIGDVELVLIPSHRRIGKAEALLGRPLVRVAGELSDGHGMMIVEITGVIDIFARDPKPKREDLGDLIAEVGFVGVMPVLQEIIDRIVFGEGGDSEGNVEEGGSSDD